MRREASYLEDIVDAIESIERFVGNRGRVDFLGDEILCAAVLQRLIVVGEAASRLSSALRDRYPDVPWRQIIAFRNFAVHGYFDLDWETVWDSATEDAPSLRQQVAAILVHEYPAAEFPVLQTDHEIPTRTMPLPTLVVHADWGSKPNKRWMATAALETDGHYQAQAPEKVGDTATLLHRLAAASGPDGSVLIGFDFPIGIPAAYAARADINSFLELLPELDKREGEWATFYSVAEDLADVSLRRPFFPGGNTKGKIQPPWLETLGLAKHELFRRCEVAHGSRPAAEMLFWTVGGKQVGRAAISGWRDVLVRGIRDNRLDVAVWPFDGELVDLIRPRRIVIAETYPAEFYRHLKVTFRRGAPGEQSGKRSQAGRAKNAGALIDWAISSGVKLHPPMVEKLREGFGPAESGEDPFDATIGLFGMLNIVLGRRPPGEPIDPQIRKIEGWILGQVQLPPST